MDAAHPDTAREITAFADLVLFDPEFVRREFEAIIANGWSSTRTPPPRRSRCAVGTHQPRRPTTWSLGHVTGSAPLEWIPARLGRTRQRSPPTG
jgi:hypothetical protein